MLRPTRTRKRRTALAGIGTMLGGIRRHPVAGSVAIVLSLINGASMVLGAMAVGWAAEAVIVPAFEERRLDLAVLLLAVSAVLAVSLLRMVTILYRGVLTGVVQFGSQRTTRSAVIRQLTRLSPSWHRRRAPGPLMSTAVSDVDMMWQPMMLFPFATGMGFMIIVAAVRVGTQDAVLAAIALTLIPLVLAANLVYQGLLVPRAREAQARRGALAEHAHESVLGAEVLRSMGRTAESGRRLRERAADLRKANVRISKVGSVFDPLIELLPTATIVVVLVVGAYRIESGHITIGLLVEFIYLLLTMTIPLNVIARFLSQLPMTVAGAERVAEVLDANEYLEDGSDEAVPRGPASLEIEDGQVRYDGSVALHVEHLRIEPGEVVAVVGATGAGKSSLLKLAARVMDPSDGIVRVAGRAVSDYSSVARSRLIGYVPESPLLLIGSIRFNLELGVARSEAELERAIGVADAAEVVESLPQGLATDVGTGRRALSGGQMQRLTIARALAGPRALLVLDDVSTSLDAITEERLLDDALELVRGHSTVLFAASRIAPLLRADRIVYLDGGRVRAFGSHRELLRTEPEYRELVLAYQRSSRVFTEEAPS